MEKLNINKKKTITNYIILWLGQSISQMGSSITGFALLIWVYQKQGSAMAVSLLSMFSILPYVAVSIVAGIVIDKFKKKSIIIICDCVASMCSFFIIVLLLGNSLEVWHLFIINMILSFMNAFQTPASKVAVGLIVSKEYFERTSGLRSFADSMITIFTPVLASIIISFWGIELILVIDIITFLIAFISILLVEIPENIEEVLVNKPSVLTQVISGYKFLSQNKELLNLMLFLSVINFIASIAFMNLLSPMILSRMSNNTQILGLINSVIGVGGIIGGIIVSIKKLPMKKSNIIFISAGLSFLLGDILMGIGRNELVWIFAAFAGSLPIPFLNAAETSLLYTKVPKQIQGRVFSIRGALQFMTMPLGYIAGGFLADYVFEPLMYDSMFFQSLFGRLVGNGAGSGIGLIFVFTGIVGTVVSFAGLTNKNIKKLNDDN